MVKFVVELVWWWGSLGCSRYCVLLCVGLWSMESPTLALALALALPSPTRGSAAHGGQRAQLAGGPQQVALFKASACLRSLQSAARRSVREERRGTRACRRTCGRGVAQRDVQVQFIRPAIACMVAMALCEWTALRPVWRRVLHSHSRSGSRHQGQPGAAEPQEQTGRLLPSQRQLPHALVSARPAAHKLAQDKASTSIHKLAQDKFKFETAVPAT